LRKTGGNPECFVYEAVALGLNQIRGNDWVKGIPGEFNEVTICVKSVQVEHTVSIGDFMKWLERKGGSPADMSIGRKVNEILGMPT